MKVLKLLCQLADVEQLQWEATSCFLAHPIHCPLSVTSSLDRNRLDLVSVASLLQNAQGKDKPLLRLEASHCCYPEGSGHPSLAQNTPQWGYTVQEGTNLFSCKVRRGYPLSGLITVERYFRSDCREQFALYSATLYT